MRLLYSDASPYSRCVRVLIRHLELDGIEECIVNPMDNDEALLDINPLGKVPCLQLNDGSPLYDSEVILRYLDHEFGANRLFGENGYNWTNECQLSLINGLLDSAVALRQEQMRELEGKRSVFWTARFEQALLRGLKEVEQSGVMVSPQLTIQQIGLACLIEYLDFRHPDLHWRNVVSAIGAWLSGFEHLSMMKSTRPI